MSLHGIGYGTGRVYGRAFFKIARDELTQGSS